MAVERCAAIKDGQQCNLVSGHAGQHQLPADPGWAPAPASPVAPAGKATKKTNKAGIGCLAVIGLLVVFAYLGGSKGGSNTSPGGGGAPAAAPASKHLTGAFLSWTAVDDSHGYAFFTVTNSGTATETAECSISVEDDFGDFGFDKLVGEAVGPGKTISGKIPLSVGKGSFLINRGEVTDC
jgi:hypothetical protein